MISDDDIRGRLEAVGMASSAPVTRGNPGKQASRQAPSARRGTQAFEDLMDEMLEDWEVEDDLLDDMVELRRCEEEDSYEYRLKGHDEWELLDDDGDEEDDAGEGDDDLSEEE